jgi:hypothetical protein
MASAEELDKIVAKLNLKVPLCPEPERKRSFISFSDLKTYFQRESAFWQETDEARSCPLRQKGENSGAVPVNVPVLEPATLIQ